MANLTPGYPFGSTEQVTNSKLATLVSGGTVSSIVDADISGSAAIAISKINITAASINYDRLNLTGSIVNADINASAAIAASKLNFGSANQGDIFVDKGSGITRLTPGTSGQFLQTLGASANPQWANGGPSNTLFQYAGSIDQHGTNNGEISPTSLTAASTVSNYRFLCVSGGSYVQIWSTKFLKIASINTVTIYARIWSNINTDIPDIKIDIGGQNNHGTSSGNVPAWITFTIDVSSLTNGTAYDVKASLKETTNSDLSYCANIMGFGS